MTKSTNLWKIGEAAKRAGVSVRTLQHYDRIGLLTPGGVTQAGYRLYGEKELLRLEQILFFRRLGFTLEEIRRVMQSSDYDAGEAMKRQRELLILQRRQLDVMIDRLDAALAGNPQQKEALDMSELNQMRKQFAEEIRMRWGKTKAYAQSEERMAAKDAKAMDEAQAQMEALMRAFAEVRLLPPEDTRVQELVRQWQMCITDHFYDCTKEILAGLGEMYTGDERFMHNIDRYGEGTAACMTRAIRVYCGGAA